MMNCRTYLAAKELYRGCKALRLPAELRDQVQRASSSVALNIAEGLGRSMPRDRRRFLDIAYASAQEVKAILDLELDPADAIVDLADKVAAHLYRLRATMQ